MYAQSRCEESCQESIPHVSFREKKLCYALVTYLSASGLFNRFWVQMCKFVDYFCLIKSFSWTILVLIDKRPVPECKFMGYGCCFNTETVIDLVMHHRFILIGIFRIPVEQTMMHGSSNTKFKDMIPVHTLCILDLTHLIATS